MTADENLQRGKETAYGCIYKALLLHENNLRTIAQKALKIYDEAPNDTVRNAACAEISAELKNWSFPVEFRVSLPDLHFNIERAVLGATPNPLPYYYGEAGCRNECLGEVLGEIAKL
jgi:hypothetical protein